jgi:hypothetical protein
LMINDDDGGEDDDEAECSMEYSMNDVSKER